MKAAPAGRSVLAARRIAVFVSALIACAARPALAQTNGQLWGNVTLDWVKSDKLTFEIKMGATCEDALCAMDFDVERINKWLRDRHLAVETTLGESWAMGLLQSYPYLAR